MPSHLNSCKKVISLVCYFHSTDCIFINNIAIEIDIILKYIKFDDKPTINA